MDIKSPRLWLLTGERGSGKTRFCRLLVEKARATGWTVSGLLSPAVFKGDTRIGMEVEDLSSHEVRPLAYSNACPGFTLRMGKWFFDPLAIAWGNEVLMKCLSSDATPRPIHDLLVIDEIGPLELVHGKGWSAALEVLQECSYQRGFVVVRPGLVELACKVLPAIKGILQPDSSLSPETEAARWIERIRDV